MSKEKSWLTPKEAGELIGMTGRNITNLINKGRISAKKDDDGRYYIEKSEFFRTYPDAFVKDKERSDEKMSEKVSIKFLEEKISHLKEMLGEKKRENAFLSGQINSITHEKSKMLDTIHAHARLLEFKETSSENTKTEEINPKNKFDLFKWLRKK